MKIIIDGQSDLLEVNDNFNIQGFAEQLDSTLFSSGRVIEKLTLEKNEIALEELEPQLANIDRNQACLDIETISLKEHLKENLYAMQDGIDQLEEQAIEISDKMLREGQLGMNELAVWAGDLAMMASNLKQFIHMFQIEEQDLKIGDLSFQAGLQKLNQFSTLIIGSIQQNKKVNISDVLQFQIANLLTSFKTLIPTLIEKVDEKLQQN